MRTKLHELAEIGQSVWCDNLSRRIIESGELQRLIDLGVAGVTSNPTIFMKAITGTGDYDERIQTAIDAGVEDVTALYERLAIPDVADAADLLRPVYDRTCGVDGYVSLEVNPRLADDTRGTIAEARRLFAELDRPNVFIKVPGTDAGVPAIETLIGEGINVNVTLIFSVAVHKRVMDAYLAGLRKLNAVGGDLSRVASVASFFVSRVDTAVDKLIEKKRGKTRDVERFLGKAAIANADLAYARFTEFFDPSGPFGELKKLGARVQRPVWASTSTKNPAYPATLYVDNLVAPQTVNTLPPETIEAAMSHGKIGAMLGENLDQSRKLLAKLADFDINLMAITDQLTIDGVKAFAQSFEEILTGLAKKQSTVRAAG